MPEYPSQPARELGNRSHDLHLALQQPFSRVLQEQIAVYDERQVAYTRANEADSRQLEQTLAQAIQRLEAAAARGDSPTQLNNLFTTELTSMQAIFKDYQPKPIELTTLNGWANAVSLAIN